MTQHNTLCLATAEFTSSFQWKQEKEKLFFFFIKSANPEPQLLTFHLVATVAPFCSNNILSSASLQHPQLCHWAALAVLAGAATLSI